MPLSTGSASFAYFVFPSLNKADSLTLSTYSGINTNQHFVYQHHVVLIDCRRNSQNSNKKLVIYSMHHTI